MGKVNAVHDILFYRSLIVHKRLRGKIGIHSRVPVKSRDDLSLAYTPGSGTSLRVIVGVVLRVRDVTIKNNSGAPHSSCIRQH